MAIISLVAGLLCIIPVSIIFGHLARSEIRKSNGLIVGQGIALAGLILSYLTLLIILCVFVVAPLAIYFMAPSLFEPPPLRYQSVSIESGKPLNMEASSLQYYKVESLIISMAGSIKSRYINVGLSLEGSERDFKKVLEMNEHRIRATALSVIGGYTYEDAQYDGFQEKVRADLKKAFSNILKNYRNGDSDLIEEIYFTTFVVYEL